MTESDNPILNDLCVRFNEGLITRNEIVALTHLIQNDIHELEKNEPIAPYIIENINKIISVQKNSVNTRLSTSQEKKFFSDEIVPDCEKPEVLLEEIVDWKNRLINIEHHLRLIGNRLVVRLGRHSDQSKLPEVLESPVEISDKDLKQIKHLNGLSANLEYSLGNELPICWPKFLIVDPTNTCNMRCRTCFQSITQDFHHTSLGNSVAESLKEILPFIAELKLFGTGEPGLAKNCQTIAATAAKYLCSVDLLTNGTALSNIVFQSIDFDRVGISVDGACEETFEAIRVGIKFAPLMEKIKEFRKLKPKTELYFNVTINRANLDEISAIAELAASLKIDTIQFCQFHPYIDRVEGLTLRSEDEVLFEEELGRAKTICDNHKIFLRQEISFFGAKKQNTKLNKQDIIGYLETLETIKGIATGDEQLGERALEKNPFDFYPRSIGHKLHDYLKNGDLTPADYYYAPPADVGELELEQKILSKIIKEQDLDAECFRLPHCTAPWTRLYVESSGAVRPCCVFEGHLGNLAESTFREVWWGEEYTELREAMANGGNLPTSCIACQNAERYHYLDEILTNLSNLGIDIQSLALPRDFEPPALVREMLSSNETVAVDISNLRTTRELSDEDI